jgi:tetratricopeptide (TPR) repeat protein
MRRPRTSVFLAQLMLGAAVSLSIAADAPAQTAWHEGRRWKARRIVDVQPPPASDSEVCVVTFFCHGEITKAQPGILVLSGSTPVPFRVIQQGPGDFIRLAFQPLKRKTRYQIYYGGTEKKATSEWTPAHGLLLEVRRFQNCDLTRLASVRGAFERSDPIGAAFVPNVFIGNLPCASNETPVLARFTGRLQISQQGRYRFYTSSRDASWLLIDGKMIVAWPGCHGPIRQARHFGDVELTPGVHRFEYHNASTGGGFMAVAAWRPPGKSKVTPIPPETFGSVRVARMERVELRSGGVLPDFLVEPWAEATLGAGHPPLVKVQFRVTARGQSFRWDFGDGQTTTSANAPSHVYLRPGEYVVRCSRPRSRSMIENRVRIDPPWHRLASKDAQADIADWLQTLNAYDVTRLSAENLRQLVIVHRELGDYATAAKIGLTGLQTRGKRVRPHDPASAAALAETLAELLDRRLGKAKEAIGVCDFALAMKPTGEPAARLWLLSADLALQQDRDDVKQRLAQAAKLIGDRSPGESRRALAALQGDLYRRLKQPAAARKAYAAARKLSVSETWDLRRRIAMQGVFSRAVEQHLRSGKIDDAGTELQKWSRQIPDCKLDGYYALLRARCDLARGRYSRARLEVGDLLAVDADSPYADRLLLVAAEAQARLGDKSKANDLLDRLIRDYPGSPLVPSARRLRTEGFPALKTTNPKKSRRRSSSARTKKK